MGVVVADLPDTYSRVVERAPGLMWWIAVVLGAGALLVTVLIVGHRLSRRGS